MTYYGVWRARHMPPPSLIRVCSHSGVALTTQLVLLTPDLFSSPSDGDKYGINYGSVLASAAAECTRSHRFVSVCSMSSPFCCACPWDAVAGIAVGVALVDPLGRKRTMALTYSVSAVFGIGVALQMGVVLTTICSFVARMAIMIASSAVWLVTPEVSGGGGGAGGRVR